MVCVEAALAVGLVAPRVFVDCSVLGAGTELDQWGPVLEGRDNAIGKANVIQRKFQERPFGDY